ncbi:DUF11 domain-containing protein, partial [Methanobrevibacter sp.]|uniref:DUF11 domain-containing protein n=1 Tax=Methanobrevibacter sp. TaxID=66852 RepID=UPI0025D5CB16
VPKEFKVIAYDEGYDNKTNTVVIPLMVVGQYYSFTITAVALVNGTLNNTANVTCNENRTVKNDTVVIRVDPRVNLTISKVADNSVVYVDDTVTFTINVTNNGPSNATNVTIKDVVPKQFNVTGSSDSNYKNNVLVIPKLAAGASYAFTITAIALTAGNWTNIANVTCNENKTVIEDNATVEVLPVVNLTINKTADHERIFVNESVIFTINVTNEGPCNATNVVITDVVPGQFRIVAYDEGYDIKTNTVTIPLMVVGKSYVFTITAIALLEGNLNNTANVTCDENRTVKNSTVNITVDPICDLEISKKVNATSVFLNDLVKWTITVVNNGPSIARNVIVNDTLPEGLKLMSTSRVCTVDGNTIIWNIGDLKANSPISLELVTKAELLGNLTNIVVVNTTTNETNKTNNEANNTTDVKPICDLAISKSVNASSVFINDLVEWTITVVNYGPSTAVDVVVRDIFPAGMKVITAASSAGSFDKSAKMWDIGEVNVNNPVSLVLVTQVLTVGAITNIVTVNSSTPDSNKTNNIANNTTVVKPICDVSISKLVSDSVVYVGDKVTWKIIVSNNGPSDAKGVVVIDKLPKSLKVVSYKVTKGTFNSKTGKWSISVLGKGSTEVLTLVTKVTDDGYITNPVVVSTKTTETDYSNNKANNTTYAKPIVDLVVDKSAENKVYSVNEKMHWIIKITNKGPSVAHDVVAFDTLPLNCKFISYSATKGTFDQKTGMWTVGELGKGETVILDIFCKVTKAGLITNEVNVTCNETDMDLSNNYDNETINVTEPGEPETPPTMHPTGNPIVYLVIAIMGIFGCFWSRNREE